MLVSFTAFYQKYFIMKLFYSVFICSLFWFTGISQNNFSLNFESLDSHYVSINPSVTLASGDYTVEGWFKSSPASELQVIFDGYQTSTANVSLYIEIQTNGTLRFLHRTPPGNSGGTNIFSTSIVNDGEWHHFAAVKGILGFMRLYIDGVLEAVSTTMVPPNNALLDIDLGRNHNGTRYFSGNLDEIRIWNIDRSMSEIQLTMNCPPSGDEPGLLGYWNFEEGAGMVTADQTLSTNAGSLQNGTLWSTDTPDLQCCTTFEKVTAQNCSFVFYGYAPQACTDLTTEVAGGTPPYSYLWDNGSTSSTINVCPSVDQTYIVTITDANDCILMDTFEVKAVNVICGNNDHKIKICHKNKNTLCIGEPGC